MKSFFDVHLKKLDPGADWSIDNIIIEKSFVNEQLRVEILPEKVENLFYMRMGPEFTPFGKYISASYKLIGQEPEGLAALQVNSFLLSEDDPDKAVLNPSVLMGIYPVEQGRHLLLAYRVNPDLPFEPYRRRVRSLEIPQRIRTGPLEEVEVDLREATQALTDSNMPSRLLVMGGEDVTVLYCVRGVHPDVALAQIKRGLDYAKVSDN